MFFQMLASIQVLVLTHTPLLFVQNNGSGFLGLWRREYIGVLLV